MVLGPTLVGGAVGAAIGVGLHQALESGMLGKPIEASWFAIVIGLMTGLGVRQANQTPMERSYARGAVAGLLALGAIVGSTFLLSKTLNKQGIAPRPLVAVAENDEGEKADRDGDQDDADSEETAPDAPAEDSSPASAGDAGAQPKVGALNPWQFIFMALGGLVAYKLGRGAGDRKPAPPSEEQPPENLGRATDPSE